MNFEKRLVRLRRRVLAATIAPALVLSTSLAFVPVTASAAVTQSSLQQDVNGLQAAGNMGVVAQVIDHGNSLRARAGVAKQGTTQPVPFNAQFRTGSDTKTMISAVLLQLEGEGKLSLDDTVDHWLPGVIHGNGNDGTQITVRQLLNHTSGLFDYTTDPAFVATIITPEGFYANRFHHYEPQDLINIALSHAPNFAPGASWNYSNTNYIVAGQVIKAVTGKTWDKELQKRIFTPLGMDDSYVPGDDPTIDGPHANGYNIYTTDPANRVYTDTTLDNMTWGGSAGAVITTTADENRFLISLLRGKVLKPAQLAEMKTLVPLSPTAGYGLGLLHQTFACSDGSTSEFWGHDGGVVGYTTFVLASPAIKKSVVVSMSTTTFSEVQYSTDTVNALNTLLLDVFCPGPAAPAPTMTPLAAPHASDLSHQFDTLYNIR